MTQLPDGELLGITGGKVLRSSDGGRNWTEIEGATAPASGMLGVLRSGRWLLAGMGGRNVDWKSKTVGLKGGYPVVKVSGAASARYTAVYYSDDQGKTWHGGEEKVLGPAKDSVPAGRFIETADGTVIMPLYVCLTEEALDPGVTSVVIARSHDEGETWTDFSVVATHGPKPDNYPQGDPQRAKRWIASATPSVRLWVM